MPELPEVETIRRGLVGNLCGRHVLAVAVGRERTVRRTSVAALRDGLEGATFTAFDRRGKYLLGSLDTGDQLMVHLRMSGQLLLACGETPRPPHTHVAVTLDDGSELRFVDPRTFGEMVVFDPARPEMLVPELSRLGPDALDDLQRSDGTRILALALRGRRAVKAVVCDQTRLAGLGNIYADEALHLAGIRPTRPAVRVGSAAAERLCRSIVAVLRAAVKARGSTLADAQYVDLMGDSGGYQLEHRVYGRAGQPCRTCRSIVRRTVISGRSSYFCPTCQRR
jgi:formamidopyrimidine-DNA glycosylase